MTLVPSTSASPGGADAAAVDLAEPPGQYGGVAAAAAVPAAGPPTSPGLAATVAGPPASPGLAATVAGLAAPPPPGAAPRPAPAVEPSVPPPGVVSVAAASAPAEPTPPPGLIAATASIASAAEPPAPPAPVGEAPAPPAAPPPTTTARAAAASLQPEAWAAALTTLPGMGPRRLQQVLARWPDPAEAWARVARGAAPVDPKLARSWATIAAGDPDRPGRVWAACRAQTVDVHVWGRPGYPPPLAADPDPPAVLFTRGDQHVGDGPRVAIVGTRRCTRYGRELARDLGRALAEAGVRVVSGLALGIDGAAHEGALAAAGAPLIGVVGSGLDVVYPRRHRDLWDRVAAAGLLAGEAPPGAAPERWRFPARNRIIAGLAHVVVVVESHARGGSRHTVDAAIERDVTVMAVPGSVRSPASAGTNELLATGMAPVRDVTDVLVALGLVTGGAGATANDKTANNHRNSDDDLAARLLDLIGWEPATAEQLVVRGGLDPTTVGRLLAELERDGRLSRRGPWLERAR
jgi:DNA processing protein